MSYDRILILDQMSIMSIDEIVNLYRNGYKLEELQICPSGCMSENDCITRVGGNLLFIGGVIGLIAGWKLTKDYFNGLIKLRKNDIRKEIKKINL